MIEVIFLSVVFLAAFIQIVGGGLVFVFFLREAIAEFFVAKSFGETYRPTVASLMTSSIGFVMVACGAALIIGEVVF